MDNFTLVERETGKVWLHNDKPVWVVHYECMDRRDDFWQAYRAVARVPKNRMPWTVDNRRVCQDKRGYRSLQDALAAADATVLNTGAA
jgi:hypothetical protein